MRHEGRNPIYSEATGLDLLAKERNGGREIKRGFSLPGMGHMCRGLDLDKDER